MSQPSTASLQSLYPWTSRPLIALAPMRLVALPALALAVSRANAIGFLGAGTDLSSLDADLATCHNSLTQDPIPTANPRQLPIGVGVLCFQASLSQLLAAITPSDANARRPPPCAIWLFAPSEPADLCAWSDAVRKAFPPGGQWPCPQIWVQAGAVAEMVESVAAARPEVIVVQGADAGGHGLAQGASLVPLVPETVAAVRELLAEGKVDRLPHVVAAGGIVSGASAAAAFALGAHGVCLGTRLMATPEAGIAQGYKEELVRAIDGGQTTVRSRVYDTLRGTHGWPERFGGRGVTNQSWQDWLKEGEQGMEENKRRYDEAVKQGDAGWGPQGRMTTYAGTGVGLVRKIQSAGDIVNEVREECLRIVRALPSIM